jgi:hypothetical protein
LVMPIVKRQETSFTLKVKTSIWEVSKVSFIFPLFDRPIKVINCEKKNWTLRCVPQLININKLEPDPSWNWNHKVLLSLYRSHSELLINKIWPRPENWWFLFFKILIRPKIKGSSFFI